VKDFVSEALQAIAPPSQSSRLDWAVVARNDIRWNCRGSVYEQARVLDAEVKGDHPEHGFAYAGRAQ
jgi:hypothetical protein